MKKKKLIWQLFPSYLLLILIALVTVTVSYSREMKSFYLDHTAAELTSRAHLIMPQLKNMMAIRDYAAVNRTVNTQARYADTRITVILPSGVVIGDSDESPAQMDNHANRPEIARALQGHPGASTRYSRTLQKNMMYVAIPVKLEKQVAGVIRTSVPVSDIDSKLDDMRLRIIFAALLISFLIAGISLYISRRISRPIEEMEKGAQQFAAGNLEHALAMPDTAELAGLAEAMNDMAAELDWKVKTAFAQRNEIRTILASMVEGVIALNPNDRIINMNQAAADILETSLPEEDRRSLQEIIRNTTLEKLTLESRVKDEPTSGDIIYNKSGEKTLHVRCAPLKDADETRIGTLLVIDDVTKLRQLENMRRDFAANVSHEIKTPLTAIKGFVETLKHHDIEDAAEQDRFLNIIDRHVSRLTNIIEDLMKLSVIEQDAMQKEIDFQKVKLRDVLQAAVDIYSSVAEERDITVVLACDPDITIEADSSLLEQAAANLLDNAIKYSEPGSEVILATSVSDTEVVIDFQDHGIGIMKKHLPRVFERFYRVDKARSRQLGGTGLGLAIVKHITQTHGGHVSVESVVNKGTTFSIHLPLTAAREEKSET
jgi:two-component system phosphate regulon sensor histidine kinase PhoR